MDRATARRSMVERVAYLMGDARLLIDIEAGERLHFGQVAPKKAEGRLRSLLRRLRRDEGGVVLIEFALVLPVLLALVLGTMTGAVAVEHYARLTSAVSEGARWSAINHADPSAQVLATAPDATGITTSTPGGWTPGATVQVCATAPLSVQALIYKWTGSATRCVEETVQ